MKHKLPKLLSMIVAIAGIAVMAGWAFDIGVLKSILPGWVTMKFNTALCFFLSGILLYAMAKYLETGSGIAQVFVIVTAFCITLFMAIFLIATLLGLNSGLDKLFVHEKEVAPLTIVSGTPSLATMIDFLLIAAAGFLVALNVKRLMWTVTCIGWILTVTGGVAVIGYLVHTPVLYYYISGFSAAMACHTAVLFVLTGVCLVLLKQK